MKYCDYFETKTRANGEDFDVLKDDAPKELIEFVREVHEKSFSTCFPQDWIYSQIRNAFDELANDELEQINIEPDYSWPELCDWLKMNGSSDFVEKALEEDYITDNPYSIFNIVQTGNLLAKTDIYNSVNDFLERRKESADGLE